MATVQITCKRDKTKYTVSVSGGDKIDQLLVKALFGIYILSAPVGMPKQTFGEFLTNKMGGTAFKNWLAKFPSLKRKYMLLSKITNKKIDLTIDTSNCNDLPPKAISAVLLPPVNLDDVAIAYAYAKLTGDSAAFEAWANEVVNRAELYATESGVELEIK